MARQYSVSLRNNWLNTVETTIGTSPGLSLFTGAQPATCASTDTGTLLVTLTLPFDWMGDASSGVKAISGPWFGTAVASGDFGYYRLKDSTGQSHEQGSSTDLSISTTAVTLGQVVVVNTWSLTAPGA